MDYLGADGSEPRVVDREAKTGTTVFCVACHNPAADRLTSVVFPSGQEVDRLGPEAKCATCHQGRQSAGQVNQVLGGVADDVISPDLSFINVHYGIAAATKWGAEAQVGYQYEGKAYSGYFGHAQGLSTCAECHDAHSLRITAAECSPCHLNVVEFGDVRDIRTSALDYDGDGDVDEGIRDELLTLHDALYAAIQAYATEVIGTPIVYADRSPFFFIDTNGNGQPDEAEINGGNGYATWTPRLVRTTYNYHFVVQDRGAYVHNPTYALQLMYDSLEDLGQQVRVDLEYMVRPAVSD
ncbi:MAG: polyheme membrane-associated cytochrome C [Chloroflexi bacterium]|nr:polyheme membrane-associated cytochrome C [Chloroflexota bacterium]